MEAYVAASASNGSGRRATAICHREMAKAVPFDRGAYPRDCDERLDPTRAAAGSNPEMMDCVQKLEACRAAGQ